MSRFIVLVLLLAFCALVSLPGNTFAGSSDSPQHKLKEPKKGPSEGLAAILKTAYKKTSDSGINTKQKSQKVKSASYKNKNSKFSSSKLKKKSGYTKTKSYKKVNKKKSHSARAL